MTWLFAALGAIAAFLQVTLLRGEARGARAPFGILLRFALVVGALVLAALNGQLLATTLAWAITFAVCSFAVVWRWS